MLLPDTCPAETLLQLLILAYFFKLSSDGPGK